VWRFRSGGRVERSLPGYNDQEKFSNNQFRGRWDASDQAAEVGVSQSVLPAATSKKGANVRITSEA
jgi:hypothetical protein